MFQRAIVCAPGENFAEGETSASLGIPIYPVALEQHRAYCRALEQCGLRLTHLQPDTRYPDLTFVEDTAVLTERGAILTRPGARSRIEEVESMAAELNKFYPELRRVTPPGLLDGGDICQVGNHFLIGVSTRTNEAGAQQLGRILASFDYTFSLVDIRNVAGLLHLKSGLAWLGDDHVVLVEALRDLEQLRGYELITVASDENYAANCVRVNDHLLLAAGYPKIAESLQQKGYQTISLELTEFQKMDGGLSCLSLRF